MWDRGSDTWCERGRDKGLCFGVYPKLRSDDGDVTTTSPSGQENTFLWLENINYRYHRQMGRRAGPDCSQRRHKAWAETFLPRLRFAAWAIDRYPLKYSQGDGINAYFTAKCRQNSIYDEKLGCKLQKVWIIKLWKFGRIYLWLYRLNTNAGRTAGWGSINLIGTGIIPGYQSLKGW